MRQDPERLYNSYGASSDMKAWDGKPMPQWADLGPKVQAHWTCTALAAAGLDVRHSDAALDRIARKLGEGLDHPGPGVLELYWLVRTWSRMSAAMNPGARGGGPLTAVPDAIARALTLIGQQHPDVLISPLAPQAAKDQAAAFMRLLGTLGTIYGAPTTALTRATAPSVILAFTRIADAYDQLETQQQPRVEADLFRAGADLVRRLAVMAGETPAS